MLVDPSMLEMLSELRMPGQPDPVHEILQVFEADIERVLGVLQVAAASGDGRGVHEAAHRMKGASANVGAVALREKLFFVEGATRDHQLPNGVHGVVDELPLLVRQSIDELWRLARD